VKHRQALSRLATPPLPGPIQPKLVVGPANDPLEHEADRVAGQVMHMSAPESPIATGPPELFHGCSDCNERPQTPRTRPDGEHETPPDGKIPDIVHDVLRSPGQALDGNVRSFFEPRFGHDFSQVRVHTDELGAQSAHEVNALAYTAGFHIVFAPGRYAPQTHTGQRLLAHELTHVVQQRVGAVKGTFAGAEYPGSISLQRQPAAPTALPVEKALAHLLPQTQAAGKLARSAVIPPYAPGLGPQRALAVNDLIDVDDFQGAIDMLVHYKSVDGEIDLSLLEGRKMYFDESVTDKDARTAQPFWEYDVGRARRPKIRIGPSAFKSGVPYLYSVIMHEYQHVLWRQTLAHSKLAEETEGHGGMNTDEVQAYAWELLHATETGLALLPDRIAVVWENLNEEYWQLDPAAQQNSRPLVMRALAKAQDYVKGSQERLVPLRPPSTISF
jgi:hypothetical protein